MTGVQTCALPIYHIDLPKLEITNSNIYTYLKDYNTFFTDYGRTAVALLYQYILRQHRGYDINILLPSYICESVLRIFSRNNVTFYDIEDGFEVDQMSVIRQIDSGKFDRGIFYLFHYFGNIIPCEKLRRIKRLCIEHQIIIVEDTTHSIFTAPCTIGDYCISSLRKWMAIPEGGVVYSKKKLPKEWEELKSAHASHKIEAMVLKNLFLGHATPYLELKDVEVINNAYREIFVQEEAKIDRHISKYRISDFSAFLLNCQNVETVGERRQENYRYLRKRLRSCDIDLYGKLELEEESVVPYTALLLFSEEKTRDSFKAYLMEHKIYCAMHWPITNEEQLQHNNVKKWTKQMISLPIDQRYGIEDMEHLAKVVISYLKGNNHVKIKKI